MSSLPTIHESDDNAIHIESTLAVIRPCVHRRKRSNVTNLNKSALSGVLGFVLTITSCVLLPAWTVDYWQAWVLISVLFVSLLGITLYLMRNDQRLLERRMHAGPTTGLSAKPSRLNTSLSNWSPNSKPALPRVLAGKISQASDKVSEDRLAFLLSRCNGTAESRDSPDSSPACECLISQERPPKMRA
jgi:hypothetical protein